MNESTLALFEQKFEEEEAQKFELCEDFAIEFELTVDYVWLEFVDPNTATLEEVQNKLQHTFYYG